MKEVNDFNYLLEFHLKTRVEGRIAIYQLIVKCIFEFLKNKILLVSLFFIVFFIACSNEISKGLNPFPINTNRLKTDEIAFVHISDTHGSMISFIPALSVLRSKECSFGVVTGDILPSQEMIDSIKSFPVPFLMIPGNHDAYDGLGQKGFRTSVLNPISDNNKIFYGSIDGNYWYKDIDKNGYLLRIIGLDEYETSFINCQVSKHSVVWSQSQIDWFINILSTSEKCNGILILLHCGFGNSSMGNRDTTNHNDFISLLANKYNNSYDYNGSSNPLLIPDIVKAYISGINITDKKYMNACKGYELLVSTKFTSPHHNFIGYFGGHLHWDEVEFLNNYDHQLQVLMAFCGNGRGSIYNDLVKEDKENLSYNLNYNIINFSTRTLKIFRIGANKKIDGTTRDSICFTF